MIYRDINNITDSCCKNVLKEIAVDQTVNYALHIFVRLLSICVSCIDKHVRSVSNIIIRILILSSFCLFQYPSPACRSNCAEVARTHKRLSRSVRKQTCMCFSENSV